MRFRAFRVDWDPLFFSKIFVSAKRKTRASEASQMPACWSAWLYQSFIKKTFSAIILFFRNCVCCERLWPLRPSNLVISNHPWLSPEYLFRVSDHNIGNCFIDRQFNKHRLIYQQEVFKKRIVHIHKFILCLCGIIPEVYSSLLALFGWRPPPLDFQRPVTCV